MIAQSIQELTNYEYNELSYNSAGILITGSFMYHICDLLNKCGIEIQPTNTYNETVENAVREFQQIVEMNNSGILNTNTLQAMIVYADRMSDTIGENTNTSEDSETKKSNSPHYNSFFEDNNYKIHRRNHKDIKIVFGNKSITKTIKDVFMRSVSVEVDTSGNPVSEVYEFIARDIKESDEINDITKYNGDEDGSSSDIKYSYNFSSINVDTKNTHGGGGHSR